MTTFFYLKMVSLFGWILWWNNYCFYSIRLIRTGNYFKLNWRDLKWVKSELVITSNIDNKEFEEQMRYLKIKLLCLNKLLSIQWLYLLGFYCCYNCIFSKRCWWYYFFFAFGFIYFLLLDLHHSSLKKRFKENVHC